MTHIEALAAHRAAIEALAKAKPYTPGEERTRADGSVWRKPKDGGDLVMVSGPRKKQRAIVKHDPAPGSIQHDPRWMARPEETPADRLNDVLEAKTGWRIGDMDVDATTGTVSIHASRFDGRSVFFHGQPRRAVLESFEGGRNPHKRGPFDHKNDTTLHFLGRQRFEGARSGLRAFADYLSDNAADGYPGLTTSDARALMRPVAGLLTGDTKERA